MPDGPRYEDDFYAWTQYQAEVLRSMPAPDNRFDREHVAEEIEDLGKSERDAVRSRIRRIVEHLLKLAYSRAEPPRLDWIATIIEARQSLSDKLTPTLRHDAEAVLEKLYADGRKRAAVGLRQHGELDAADQLPPSCPWSLDEICEEDWYPTSTEPDRTS
jgi:Domain of unknown function DUF29